MDQLHGDGNVTIWDFAYHFYARFLEHRGPLDGFRLGFGILFDDQIQRECDFQIGETSCTFDDKMFFVGIRHMEALGAGLSHQHVSSYPDARRHG